MSLPPDPPAPDTPPRPVAELPRGAASRAGRTARNAMLAGASLVWLVPILALLVTLALAWRSYADRGELIQVAFADATGVTPGETVLKFREVSVGKVESVHFTNDLSRVVLDIRVDKGVAAFIDSEAQFWVVRPQVSAAGISRLDTVLTGVFVEGDWDARVAGPPAEPFIGLDRAPLTRANQAGTWVVLASDTARGLGEGAPVMYHGVAVGRMENLRLAEDGGVLADVFISAPHDRRLTSTSAFWTSAGLSVSLGAQGLALNVDSLASLLQGGVQFDTLTSGGAPVTPGTVFRLQPDAEAAKSGLLLDSEPGALRLTVLVEDAVRGLAKGAEVDYKGLAVGRVTDLGLRTLEATGGAPRRVAQDVTITLLPSRLGLAPDSPPAAVLDFLAGRVAQGLRARVAGSGFLGTSLMIELVELPEAAPAAMVMAEPYPILPSVPGKTGDLAGTAQDVIGRIGRLPLEETLVAARNALEAITTVAASEDTRAVPAELRGALTEIRAIAEGLRSGGALENTQAALASARALAERLAVAAEKLPALMDRLDTATAGLGQVDFASIGAELNAALAELRDVIGSPEAAALPGRVAALAERATDVAGRIGGLADQLAASGALARAGGAVDAVTGAAQALGQSVAGVPQAVERIDGVAQQIAAADLPGLGAAAKGAAQGLQGLVSGEAAQALPGRANEALAALGGAATEVQTVARQLGESGAAAKLGPLLDEAQAAVEAVRAAAADVPAMVERIDAAAASVDEFDFAGVSAEAKGIVADLRAMLGTEDAQQLPKNLSDTLASASGLLNDLRDGNAAGSLNAALGSAKTAADEIANVARRLPQLSQRYEQLAARAEAVIAAYGDRSPFNTEAIAMLRELRRATAAFGQLAQTIERNPRAFILGR